LGEDKIERFGSIWVYIFGVANHRTGCDRSAFNKFLAMGFATYAWRGINPPDDASPYTASPLLPRYSGTSALRL